MDNENQNLDKAEKFLIVDMGRRHPDIPRSTRLKWAMNYNLEKEIDELFHSDDYEKQIDRARAMFPGMPEEEIQAIAFMMCKHRSKSIDKGGHSEERKEEIEELEMVITDPELVEISVMDFWG